jgi:hypothetical protein
LIGQFGGGFVANDLVDVSLKTSLGRIVDSQEDDAEIDAVRGCFVACEKKNKGIAYNFRFEGRSVDFGFHIEA